MDIVFDSAEEVRDGRTVFSDQECLGFVPPDFMPGGDGPGQKKIGESEEEGKGFIWSTQYKDSRIYFDKTLPFAPEFISWNYMYFEEVVSNYFFPARIARQGLPMAAETGAKHIFGHF
jgi:hypothetical protein